MTTAELDQAWPGFTAPSASLDTRFCWDIVLEAAAAGWHPERMQQMIAVAAHSFDTTVGDPMYGNLGINYGAPVPTDNNVGIFCMQCAAATWELYRSNLPAAAQDSLTAAMTLGLNHVLSYNVGAAYTNIYLLKACDAILLGESLGNTSSTSQGYGMLSTWITWTQGNGVSEFLSPTYYGVDLEAMATVQNLAQQASGRAAAYVIQNLLWSDIAAHWFAPNEVMAGAHGRDHDYLHGHGKCDVQLQLAGWLKNRTPDMEDFPNASSSYFTIAGSPPPAAVSSILQQIPRTVTARWGSNQRTAYISNHVTLASTSGSYTLEDKLLSMSMAGSGDTTVNIAYVLDGFNDPYGQVSSANTVGNMSVQHLIPKVLAQQSGTDALYLVSEQLAQGSRGFSVLTGVHSDILIPNGASLWSGDTAISLPAAGTQLSLSTTLPLFIHYGDAAAGIRVLYADDVTGKASTLALVNDGGAYNACRLLIEHAATTPTASVNVQTALHIEVADGLTSATFATFRSHLMATTYGVTANASLLDVSATTSSGLLLHLAMNLTTNQPSVIGFTPTTSALMVNGVDIASAILNSTAPAPASTPAPAPAPASTTTSPAAAPNVSPSPSSPTATTSPSAPAASSTNVSSVSQTASASSGGHGCGIGSGLGLLALALGSTLRVARRP